MWRQECLRLPSVPPFLCSHATDRIAVEVYKDCYRLVWVMGQCFARHSCTWWKRWGACVVALWFVVTDQCAGRTTRPQSTESPQYWQGICARLDEVTGSHVSCLMSDRGSICLSSLSHRQAPVPPSLAIFPLPLLDLFLSSGSYPAWKGSESTLYASLCSHVLVLVIHAVRVLVRCPRPCRFGSVSSVEM
jgi:hypothetical protein